MKALHAGAALTTLLLWGAGPLHAQKAKKVPDIRLAPVTVPLDREIRSSLQRIRDLCAAGKIQPAATLLEGLTRKDLGRPFPAGPGWYLPLSQVLDQTLLSLDPSLREAWETRVAARARRLLKLGLSQRDEESLLRAAAAFPGTRVRRRALLALADIALEDSRLVKALALLERARLGATPREEGDALIREAFAWARLGRKAERDRAAKRLRELGLPVPFLGRRIPPEEALRNQVFRIRTRGLSSGPWQGGPAARLWIRSTLPPQKWRPARQGFRVFNFRGGGLSSLLPYARGPQELMDASTPIPIFTGNRILLRTSEGLLILEADTGRFLGKIEKPPSRPDLDPSMPQPLRPSWALAERTPAVAGDLVLFLCKASSLRPRIPDRGHRGILSAQSGWCPARLSAYRISSGTLAWTFSLDGRKGLLSKAWFHTGPAITGETAAVLVQSGRAFYLVGLSARTGRLRWIRFLHSAGTGFLRPPALPLLAADGIFYAATGAGAVCAVDARDGSILWLTAYPRKDPFFEEIHPFQQKYGSWVVSVKGIPAPGFQVSPLLLSGEVLVLAPPDGDFLLGISALDGRILWRCSRRDPREPDKTLPAVDHLLGGDGELAYLAGKKLMAVEIRTGRKMWEVPLPPLQGRGVVADRTLLLTTTGAIFWVEKAPPHSAGIIHVEGRLPDPKHLHLRGPFLLGTSARMTALWALVPSWTQTASDPAEKARRLALCGRLRKALEIARKAPGRGEPRRAAAWSLDLARRLLEDGKKAQALRVLDRARKESRDPLDQGALLELRFRILDAAGREAEAEKAFLEFLDTALEAAKEEKK